MTGSHHFLVTADDRSSKDTRAVPRRLRGRGQSRAGRRCSDLKASPPAREEHTPRACRGAVHFWGDGRGAMHFRGDVARARLAQSPRGSAM